MLFMIFKISFKIPFSITIKPQGNWLGTIEVKEIPNQINVWRQFYDKTDNS